MESQVGKHWPPWLGYRSHLGKRAKMAGRLVFKEALWPVDSDTLRSGFLCKDMGRTFSPEHLFASPPKQGSLFSITAQEFRDLVF